MRCTLPLAVLAGVVSAQEAPDTGLPRADGYRGLWYANQPTGDEHVYKYSGGLATYPQQHVPIAVYRPEVDRTFFVYGGVSEGGSLLHMVSFFDHASGTLPRPAILLDKRTRDAHDNPTLALDGDGHLWVFSNAHGTARPSYVHRSLEPYSIDAFERMRETNFSYGQPWVVEQGFCLLHTKYGGGRRLFVARSPDGREWPEPTPFAHAARGHYQVSWSDGRRVGTAFNVHPREIGLNARTDLFCAISDDGGASWTNAAGEPLALPLTTADNPALVRRYSEDGLLVYLKQVAFDRDGRPVLLYLTSKGYEPGPGNGPRTWHTARWDGERWHVHPVTTSDHNYDYGSLWIDERHWRLVAPTDPGPRPWGTGGEIVEWRSTDRGRSWSRHRNLTAGSPRNHTYLRRVVGGDDGFLMLWADGDVHERSPSHLHFADAGGRVFRMPPEMDGDTARPERLPRPGEDER